MKHLKESKSQLKVEMKLLATILKKKFKLIFTTTHEKFRGKLQSMRKIFHLKFDATLSMKFHPLL
ncbi:MAG: hypothetical protein COV37_10005 [Bdellovibrio sp. CG11_big_fil_rev_8_21_14_0_20_39_38]|nr:MAG: hypothetical protein COV37_10005 [Bdellovibrio sp. CG11_big_fil_rev_8_21_14_0_20_39_38]